LFSKFYFLKICKKIYFEIFEIFFSKNIFQKICKIKICKKKFWEKIFAKKKFRKKFEKKICKRKNYVGRKFSEKNFYQHWLK